MPFYFFDFLFTFYLVSVALLVVRLFSLWKQFGRPSWIRITTTGVVAIGWILLMYAWLIEPNIIITNTYQVELGGKTQIRAVVIADIQVGPLHEKKFTERIVKKINALAPDVVFIPGDFVERDKNSVENLSPLQNIIAPLGVYGVLGDHDITGKTFDEIDEDKLQHVMQRLTDFHVHILINQTAQITKGNTSFVLAGVDEIKRNPNLPLALKSVPKNKPIIVLSHKPDIIDVARMMNTQLVISGHTHGGQIRLPWYGAITTMSALPLQYDRGLFKNDFKPTQLFITSGLGESIMPLRFGIPPEIAVLNLSV